MKLMCFARSWGYCCRMKKSSPTSSSCPSEVSSECSENLNSTFFSENSSDCGDEIPLDIVAELQETLFGDISTSLVNILDIVEEGKGVIKVLQHRSCV